MATGARQVVSYAHGASAVPLLGETIGVNLERTAARFADRPALVSRHQDVRLTYAQFDAEVDRVARALLAAGFEAGERIGIWSPNRVEWALVQYATAKAGVAKAYALQAGREIRVIVEPTEVDDDGAALLSHEIAREIEDQLEYPGQVKVIVIRESRAIEVPTVFKDFDDLWQPFLGGRDRSVLRTVEVQRPAAEEPREQDERERVAKSGGIVDAAHRTRDIDHRLSAVLTRPLQDAICLLLGRARTTHENTLGALDDLAVLELTPRVGGVAASLHQIASTSRGEPHRRGGGGGQVAELALGVVKPVEDGVGVA